MKDRLLLLIGIICLVVMCISGFMIFQYYSASNAQEAQYEAIAEIYQNSKDDGMAAASKESDLDTSTKPDADTKEERTESIAELKEINSDCVGFLIIPDTNIAYPVVKKDNSYYLKHNFMNESASSGAIFLDEKCEADDSLLLIHGHHMKSGTMFGALSGYKKEDFRNQHKEIMFDNGNGEKVYHVFGVSLVDLTKENYFHYDELPQNLEEKKTYINTFLKTAVWKEKDFSEADYEKNMILLSTCEYGTQDQRLVVLGVEK